MLRRLGTLILILCLLPLAGRATPAAAQSDCRVEVTAAPRLNLRAGPGTGHPVVRVINDGTLLVVVELRDMGADRWARVRLADGSTPWGAVRYGGQTLIAVPGTAACRALEPTTGPACTGLVRVNLNLRAGPGTDYAVARTLPAGTRVTAAEARGVGADTWYRLTAPGAGWVAGRYAAQTYVALENTAACHALGGGRAAPAVGWHATIPNIATGDLTDSLNILHGHGWRPVVKSVEDLSVARAAAARGGIGVFRLWRAGDCVNPALDPRLAAAARYTAQAPYLPAPAEGLWIEVDNECIDYFRNLAWLDVYLSELIRVYAAHGYTIIFGTQPPGWWEAGQVQALRATWTAARQHGACLGYHAYGVTPGRRVADSDDWTGYRHRRIRAWLAAVGFGDVPLCATEVGTGTGRDPFRIDDFVDYVARTRDDGLLLIAWWTAGEWGGMTANGQMAAAARALPPPG